MRCFPISCRPTQIFTLPKYLPVSNLATCEHPKTGLNFLLLFAVLHDRRRRCCVSDQREKREHNTFCPSKIDLSISPAGIGDESGTAVVDYKAANNPPREGRSEEARRAMPYKPYAQGTGKAREERRSTNSESPSRTAGCQFCQ